MQNRFERKAENVFGNRWFIFLYNVLQETRWIFNLFYCLCLVISLTKKRTFHNLSFSRLTVFKISKPVVWTEQTSSLRLWRLKQPRQVIGFTVELQFQNPSRGSLSVHKAEISWKLPNLLLFFWPARLPQVYWQIECCYIIKLGRRGGLMVSASALDSRASGLGSSPGWGHCVVFLGKTLNSHSASLSPGVQMRTWKLNAGG